jgi:hypothetical protein
VHFQISFNHENSDHRIDDSTASALKQRAAERGVTVPELVAELVTIAVSPAATDAAEIAELDRAGKRSKRKTRWPRATRSSDGFKHGARQRSGAGIIDEAGMVGRCSCRY